MRPYMTTGLVTTIICVLVFLVVAVLGITSGRPSLPWTERLDITVLATDSDAQGRAREPAIHRGPVGSLPAMALATASPPDMMLCVADASGHMQCHHRDSVLPCRIDAAGMAVCSGLTRHLRSHCQEAFSCGGALYFTSG